MYKRQGCNFRCPFCHNALLVTKLCRDDIFSEQDILDFLQKREGLLDGVCVTGGEPLMQKGLPAFLEKVKAMGFAVKVDTCLLYTSNRPKGKGVTVSVSCSAFVPKPFTPFQWEPQDDIETIRAKQKHLVENARSRKIRLSWSDPETSFLEAVLARGDRRVCAVIYEAYKLGCKFDSWGEYFHFDVWMKAFENCGVDPKMCIRDRNIQLYYK